MDTSLVISYAVPYDIHKFGLLPNGNFEYGPKQSELKGTVVTNPHAFPNWEISGFVEYIKSGQKQGDMLLVVPQGGFAVRLGNEASIKQKLKVRVLLHHVQRRSDVRTGGDAERVHHPNLEKRHRGIMPIQTMYSSNGWDSYAWGFNADFDEIELVIHNPGVEEDAACGPLIDSVALKLLASPKRTRGKKLGANLLKNGNFEEGPYVFPNTSWGVLIPPHIEDNHSPLPGWIIESLKAVKYIDSKQFSVPEGWRAIELVGKESALAQAVFTLPGKLYALTFTVGDSNNACEGSLVVEAFAGKDILKVPTFYTMAADHSGSLCGPVIDDVKLLSVRKRV
ncbi:hypothetical protein ACFX2G_047746 [Malus domestica]